MLVADQGLGSGRESERMAPGCHTPQHSRRNQTKDPEEREKSPRRSAQRLRPSANGVAPAPLTITVRRQLRRHMS